MLTLFAIKPIVLLALSDAMLTLATLRSRLWHINVMYAQSWSTVLRCGSHTPLVLPGSWELVQRRAARYTLGRYLLTSSVDAMLTQLEWEPLAARCHTARLVMFYKIHNGLVAIPMPLLQKLYPLLTRTANSQSYHIPTSLSDYHLHSFYARTVPIGIFFLRLLLR